MSKTHFMKLKATFAISDDNLRQAFREEDGPDYSELYIADIAAEGCPCFEHIGMELFDHSDVMAEAAIKLLLHAMEKKMEETGSRKEAQKLLSRVIKGVSKKSLDMMLKKFANGNYDPNTLN